VTDLADQQAKVGQAIQPQADTLALFAALAGLAGCSAASWSSALRTTPS
jgi:hypothetical protein